MMEEQKTKSGFATASLVLGIIGICTSFIPVINNISFILGIIGIVFAIVALVKKAGKGMAIAGLVISIIAIVITLGCQKLLSDGLNSVVKELENTNTTITSSTSSNDTKVNTEKKVNVGESVSTSDTKITYVSASDYTSYKKYFEPKDGNKIIRAEFVFENISSSDVSLSSFECYANGEKCDDYYTADDYKSPTLESLSSGKKLTAVVYYEVPKNAESIVLEYETSFWTDNKVEFVVK